MKRNVIYIIVAIILVLSLFLYNFLSNRHESKTLATANSTSITSQADWQGGLNINTDLTTIPGSVKIQLGGSKVDTTGMTVTTNTDELGKLSIIDGSLIGDGWTFGHPHYWKIDFGEEMQIGRFRANGTSCNQSPYLKYSTDDVSYSTVQTFTCSAWTDISFSAVTARYMMIESNGTSGPPFSSELMEVEFYLANNATNTMTIDGTANFWDWEAFTDVKTVPANTSATYQYRTSANGTDWTAWVGSIGSVTSRSGDDSNNPTRYRYLQIKATLSNTDGTSTPTIDSYSIDYHTEVKPTAPTAQSAVVR